MPVMLAPDVAVVWLHPDVTDAQTLTALLHPCMILPLAFDNVSKVVQ